MKRIEKIRKLNEKWKKETSGEENTIKESSKPSEDEMWKISRFIPCSVGLGSEINIPETIALAGLYDTLIAGYRYLE